MDEKEKPHDFLLGRQRKKSFSGNWYQPKWWEKNWSEIEKELSRQEASFAEEKAACQIEKQELSERRKKKREKREKRIQKNLDWLREKYALTENSNNQPESEKNNPNVKTVPKGTEQKKMSI